MPLYQSLYNSLVVRFTTGLPALASYAEKWFRGTQAGQLWGRSGSQCVEPVVTHDCHSSGAPARTTLVWRTIIPQPLSVSLRLAEDLTTFEGMATSNAHSTFSTSRRQVVRQSSIRSWHGISKTSQFVRLTVYAILPAPAYGTY